MRFLFIIFVFNLLSCSSYTIIKRQYGLTEVITAEKIIKIDTIGNTKIATIKIKNKDLYRGY